MKCNPISAGQAIYREGIEQFNSGNLKFSIIGPTFQDLQELRESWKDCLRQKNIRPKIINKAYSKAFESYLNKIEEPSENIKISLESLTSIKALALAKFIPDPSLNNKSSLSFMLQSALLHKDLKCKAPLIEPNLRRNLGKWST